MLVELKAVEQRYRAVIDVLDGMSVTEVAQRNGVSRQSVHTWLRRYANGGMAALADKSSKPESCPHQMAPVIEARVVELRRAHPKWGPRSIRIGIVACAPWRCSRAPNSSVSRRTPSTAEAQKELPRVASGSSPLTSSWRHSA